MSLDDLNREQKRSLKKMGALDEQGRPTRAPAPQVRKKEGRTRKKNKQSSKYIVRRRGKGRG